MPVIGNYERFAVGYKLDDDDHGSVWLFGRICFWIKGVPVGDWMDESLRDFVFQLEEVRRHRGQRDDRRLRSLPAERVVDILERSPEERSARHNLAPKLDVFAHWKVFVVEADDAARLIYRADGGKTRELVVAPDECDQVLETARLRIGALYMDEIIRAPWARP